MNALNESDSTICLDLIEITNSPNWKLQRLKDELSQICWQYTKSQALIQSYMGEEGRTKTIWAHVVHFVTPIDMKVRPTFANRIYQKLITKLGNFASNHVLQCFSNDQLMESVPCLAYANHRFFRGKIVRVSDKRNVEVENVDNGERFLLTKEVLKALPMQFGRIPPLSLKCFLNDAGACALDSKKVIIFRKQISDCKDLVRIEFCSNEEPFRVNVLHPTMLERNFAETFLPRTFEVDGEISILEPESEQGNQNEEKLKFKNFPRMPRRSLQYYVSHIENARAIFLKSEIMKSSTMEMENFINLQWEVFEKYDRMKREKTVLIKTCSGRYHRACMNLLSSFFLIDHGNTLLPGHVMQIRNIPRNWLLYTAPGVHKVHLTGRSKYPPHYSETKILRELLPTGVKVYFNSGSGDSASEGNLESENHKDLILALGKRLHDARINPSCMEVLPYNKRTNR